MTIRLFLPLFCCSLLLPGVWGLAAFADEVPDSEVLETRLSGATGETRLEILETLVLVNAKNDPAKSLKYGLALVESLDGPDRVTKRLEIMNKVTWAHFRLGDYDEALRYNERVGALAERVGDRLAYGGVLKLRGSVHLRRGDFKKCREAYLEALALFREVKNDEQVATVLNNLGILFKVQGNYQQALEYYLQALAIHEKNGNRAHQASCLNNVGQIFLFLEENDKAQEYYERALELKKELGDKRAMASTYNNLASLHQRAGRHELAHQYLSEALALGQATGNLYSVGLSFGHRAHSLIEMKRYDEALADLGEALKRFERMNARAQIIFIRRNTARLYRETDRLDEALVEIRSALALAEEIDAKEEIGRANEEMSLVLAARGDYQGALEAFRRFKKVADEVFSENSYNRISFLREQFETLKKEKEIEGLRAVTQDQVSRLAQEKLTQRLVLAILLVVFLCVITLLMRLHSHRQLVMQMELNRTLEQRVAARTEALEARNEELVTLDEVVRAINREADLKPLLAAVLKETKVLLPGAETSSILMYDADEDLFELAAFTGYDCDMDPPVRLTQRDVAERYMSHPPRGDGIWIIEETERLTAPESIKELPKPRSLLAMSLELAGECSGFLILGNLTRHDAFRVADPGTLQRLREHTVSAVAKARVVHNLVHTQSLLTKTQHQLVQAAHRAGMSEIAVGVLHNLGNALNSVNATCAVLEQRICDNRGLRILDGVSELLRDHERDLAGFFSTDRRGKMLPEVLTEVSRRLRDTHDDIANDLDLLKEELEEVLKMVRAQHDLIEPQILLEPVNVNRLVQEVLAAYARDFREERVVVERHLGEVPTVVTERFKLSTVLHHLLRNALESFRHEIPESRKTITVATLVESEDRLLLEVADSGVGIPDAQKSMVFRQGYSTKSHAAGLGLHFCANALKEVGGRIQVSDNREGPGTLVRVWLPVRRSDRKGRGTAVA
ncbi:tetratricopeptide repeat protein [Sulfidibacter corallicola]|uniref:histidine kinase n=1 Tax=Sulfidibacter corallicola TaxID=2818388 RepID=A0A8A4TPL1_SULCO|nr:tetratricopeptide repeat protein [Sulfidibacter corallicola]QTD51483.1 tetratricopeptide repeat protein [Sulfidibacter corallicola]